jgi:uncharacterized protein YecT (DUF1311 family)
MKNTKLILCPLIMIGVGLLITQKFWILPLVSLILSDEEIPLSTDISGGVVADLSLPAKTTSTSDPAPCVSGNDLPSNFLYENSAIEQNLDSCTDSDSSTYGMNMCGKKAMDDYDALLAMVYELITTDLDEYILKYPDTDETHSVRAEKDEIIRTKELFTQYRSSVCLAAAEEATSGSMSGLLYSDCYLHTTRAHIQLLCALGDGINRCEGSIQF